MNTRDLLTNAATIAAERIEELERELATERTKRQEAEGHANSLLRNRSQHAAEAQNRTLHAEVQELREDNRHLRACIERWKQYHPVFSGALGPVSRSSRRRPFYPPPTATTTPVSNTNNYSGMQSTGS